MNSKIIEVEFYKDGSISVKRSKDVFYRFYDKNTHTTTMLQYCLKNMLYSEFNIASAKLALYR